LLADGIASYERGEGLQRFLIQLDGAAAAVERAQALGYAVSGSKVTGPDGYVYELVESGKTEAKDPFGAVVLQAANPGALASWYVDLLGMSSSPLPGGAVELSFGGGGVEKPVRFVIEPSAGGAAPRIEQWEGRNAIALPEDKLRAINEILVASAPELIIHSMRELHEKLGTLFIVILRDVGGYEVCLVSIETFDPSVREATNYVGPDWKQRDETLAKVAGLKSLDEARRRMFAKMRGAGEEEEEEEEGDEDEDEDEDEEDEDEEESKEEGDANKDEM
jgi:hypothetical protein